MFVSVKNLKLNYRAEKQYWNNSAPFFILAHYFSQDEDGTKKADVRDTVFYLLLITGVLDDSQVQFMT